MTKKSIGPILLLLLLICARAQSQNYSIMPAPFETAFDNNGLIISGACIWTYGAGTTTPVTTYVDTLGTQNSNPIIADSAGRFTAFLLPGNAYKFVFEAACVPPAHGVAMRTADQILGTPIALPINQQNQTITVFNVQTGYGAAGTGLVDDTMAIQSAINDCGKAIYGGIVYLPAGVYKTSAALTNTFSNCAIQGAGRLSTTISASNATQDILDISGPINDSVTDLTFSSMLTKTAGAALAVSGNNGASRFARLHFLGTQYQCINITSAQVFWIEDDVFDYCQQFSIGVQSTATMDTGIITGNLFLSLTSGNPVLGHVYQQSGANLRITGNTFYLAGGAVTAMNIVGGSGGYIDGNSINASTPGGVGIAVSSSVVAETVGQNNIFLNPANFVSLATNASTSTGMGKSAVAPYVSLYYYGAICDGTTNNNVPMQAALAAGETKIFLPPNCLWNPPINGGLYTIPGNLDIMGGDIATSKIWVPTVDVATHFLNLGPNTVLRNINVKGEGCNLTGTLPANGCPEVMYWNNDSTHTIPMADFGYALNIDVGGDANSLGVGKNGISVNQRGDGGGIYGQYYGQLTGTGSNSGSGIQAGMAYSGATGQGLLVSQLADGTGTSFINTLTMGAAAGGTCCLRPMIGITSSMVHGNIVNVFGNGANFDGTYQYVNFPTTFTGNFANYTRNNVSQYSVTALGHEIRNGLDTLSAGATVTPGGSTLSPTAQMFGVGGAQVLSTITVATIGATQNYCLDLMGVAGSSWTLTTGGNIAAAHAHPGVGHALRVCWDVASALWWPGP